jgi:hypothetical protein
LQKKKEEEEAITRNPRETLRENQWGEITKNLEGITRNQNRNKIRQKNHPVFYCITAPS